MKIALITNGFVDNVIEAAGLTAVCEDGFRSAFPFDIALGVDGSVMVGDVYDDKSGHISRNGERVFPPVGVEELQAQVAKHDEDLQDVYAALVELAEIVAGGDSNG